MSTRGLRFVMCVVLACGGSAVVAACDDNDVDGAGSGVVDVTPDGGGASDTGARDSATSPDTSVTDAGLEADAADAHDAADGD